MQAAIVQSNKNQYLGNIVRKTTAHLHDEQGFHVKPLLASLHTVYSHGIMLIQQK